MIKGSCLCGGIAFEISGVITNSRYCHCENCRKFSGTAPAAWGLTTTANFKQTNNDTELGKFESGSGSMRTFCTNCGSPLWFEPETMPAYRGIALGAIDESAEGEISEPDMHLWVRSCIGWDKIHDDLQQHQTVSQ